MRKAFLLIAFICLVQSCNRYPDPSFEIVSSYTFGYLDEWGKKYFAGEWAGDSISFRAVKNSDTLNAPFKVIFKVLTGGGKITVVETSTNKEGIATTKWKLGQGSFIQTLRATTYDMSWKYLTQTDFLAYGYRTDKWDSCTSYPENNMMGLVADTVNKVTLMVTNNVLYRQGTRYYLWEEIANPLLNQSRTVNIDRNGIIYVSTWNGEVLKSSDHGVSWNACTKPYPDRYSYIEISVSNDNSLWVFDYEHPSRFSSDGGTTWANAGNGLSATLIRDVFRLKDGSLIFIESNCNCINRSFDNCLTWTAITTPGLPLKLYVNDKDEIFIASQEDRLGIYKSDDYGTTFSKVNSIYPDWWSSMDNIFNKWGDFYYVLIPGYGILKSSDLTNYTLFWKKSSLRNLFIDHNGVLIAKDWNGNAIYYMKNSN